MNSILDIDQKLFFFLNGGLRNPLFDFIMPYLRERDFWIPLYVILTAYVIWTFRKYSWIIIVGAIITVVMTDQLSSSVIKPVVQRLRPCNDPELSAQVHLLVGCGGGYSFVSSHAANHFGIAFFLIVLFKSKISWITPVAILWALLIAFAQVYVGVHFPLDIIGGGILGIIIGTITGMICKNLLTNKIPSAFIK